MAIENSREIEKIFYQDSYGKKKIGSNAHRRVGTVKGGVHGGIIFSKKKYKRYEKNFKTKSNNVYDNIISYDKFKTYSEQTQYEMLKEWMNQYSKEEIKRKMGVGETRLRKLLNEFDIKKESCGMMRASRDELEYYKNNDIPEERFQLLPDDQKFEIVDYYNQHRGMTNKEIAKMLNYIYNSFNSRKSNWKKKYEERNDYNMSVRDYKDDFLLEGEEEYSKDNTAKQANPEKPIKVKETLESSYSDNSNDTHIVEGFRMAIDGVYTGDKLSEKSKAISILIDQNKKYKATILIEELKG